MGLDLSLTGAGVATASTVVCLRPPKVQAGRTRTAEDNLARLLWFKTELARLFERERPQLVVLEDHSGGHTPSAHVAFQLGEQAGVVKVMLANGRVPMVLVASSQRQKFATGKGNASKVEVLIAARDRFGYEGHDDNEADAIVLRAMGCEAMGQPLLTVPATHRAALDKVEWPAWLRETA